ncbi:hypothetical protein SADUNF_Sadunf05G0107300 [Salix dunnii]|uniref:Uncharacterized protein n=1 Tax=Salix dunnii TaxID=1413687 RepID=A0A835K834_9ROSI|nr:hypothetical protein SADUNF_Sadunf05G0107300 [Salix dunnii]
MEQLLAHCANAIESNDATLSQQILWVLTNIAPPDGVSNPRTPNFTDSNNTIPSIVTQNTADTMSPTIEESSVENSAVEATPAVATDLAESNASNGQTRREPL